MTGFVTHVHGHNTKPHIKNYQNLTTFHHTYDEKQTGQSIMNTIISLYFGPIGGTPVRYVQEFDISDVSCRER